MSKVPSLSEIGRCPPIETLQKSLDQTYHQLLEAAKADWHRLFAGQDPSDGSVTVRISQDQIAEELAGMPQAGFLLVRAKQRNGKVRRRLA